MLPAKNTLVEITDCPIDKVPAMVSNLTQPVIFRDLVEHWPMVKSAKQSLTAAQQYLLQFYQQATVTAFTAQPKERGRIFYNEDLSGFNFSRERSQLDQVINKIQQHTQDALPPAFYVGSTSVEQCLPGFKQDNDLPLGSLKSMNNIWLGNQTRVAAHYDGLDNLACVAAGRRRFTLFAPDQVENLYIGPLDFTPAGQPISLVDFHQPDFAKYPKFKQALKHAQIAELGPGDALFIPAMWWHQVEGLASFNVLINYWWSEIPSYLASPNGALHHALLSLRDLPKQQRQAWQGLFDYYIFNADEHSKQHIPQQRRALLEDLDETSARRLRSMIINSLNR